MPKSEATRIWARNAMLRRRREGKPRALTAIRSHSEVAEILAARGDKISRSRVEQIEWSAMQKLRQALGDLAGETEPLAQRDADDLRQALLAQLDACG